MNFCWLVVRKDAPKNEIPSGWNGENFDAVTAIRFWSREEAYQTAKAVQRVWGIPCRTIVLQLPIEGEKYT